MFLTDEELFELTGYVRNADRRRWLTKNGWKFETNAITGKPAVSRIYAESRLSGTPVKVEPKLNMSWVKR